MKTKKLLAGILAFATAFTATATPLADYLPKTAVSVLTASAATDSESGLEYIVKADGTVEITGYSTEPTGFYNIPETIGGKTVTSIGEGAFSACDGITTVIFTPNIVSIGDRAF